MARPEVCAVHANVPYAHGYNIEPTAIRDQWPERKLPLQVENGYLEVPDGRGLGMELDDDMVKRLAEP